MTVSLGNRLGKQEGQKLQIPFASEISNMLIYIYIFFFFQFFVCVLCPIPSGIGGSLICPPINRAQDTVGRPWTRPPSIQ